MLCARCKQLPRERNRSREAGPQSLPGWDRLKFIMCSWCGELLRTSGQDDPMLDKLTGLARFGLAAGTSTILEP